ncbi:MAG: phage portal protein, partial [Nitrospinaceae bacterium]
LPLPPASSIQPRYEPLAREGYTQNSVVYACIREITGAAASVPWLLYQNGKNGRVEAPADHPLLRLLARPNPFMGRFEWMEALISQLLLSGNAYAEAAGPRHGPPAELYPLRPDRMTVIPDRKDWIAGYEYRVGGQTVRFSRGQIMHLKLFHPLDDWYGLSPLQVAALAVDKLNASDRWNTALLRNSAVPSGALVSKKRLTDEQFDRLRNEMQTQMQGVQNARLPLLLEEDLDWKELGTTPKEMDWIEGLKFSALQIAQIYNVPPELIGLNPATYQNRKEARKALYTEVVLPALRRLAGALNVWLAPRFDAGLELDIDTDRIEALAEDRESLWRRANAARFLTLNEKRELLGYGPLPGGDQDPSPPPTSSK